MIKCTNTWHRSNVISDLCLMKYVNLILVLINYLKFLIFYREPCEFVRRVGLRCAREHSSESGLCIMIFFVEQKWLHPSPSGV